MAWNFKRLTGVSMLVLAAGLSVGCATTSDLEAVRKQAVAAQGTANEARQTAEEARSLANDANDCCNDLKAAMNRVIGPKMRK